MVTVYIDLSAKIEQWNKASAIAMANNEIGRVYLVSSRVKQQSRQRIKEIFGPTFVQYQLMAALIYIIVKESLPIIDYIVIDRDYSGANAEAIIKNLLLEFIRRNKPEATSGMIYFDSVKNTPADILAKMVYDRRFPADREVKFREIAQLLRK